MTTAARSASGPSLPITSPIRSGKYPASTAARARLSKVSPLPTSDMPNMDGLAARSRLSARVCAINSFGAPIASRSPPVSRTPPFAAINSDSEAPLGFGMRPERIVFSAMSRSPRRRKSLVSGPSITRPKRRDRSRLSSPTRLAIVRMNAVCAAAIFSAASAVFPAARNWL